MSITGKTLPSHTTLLAAVDGKAHAAVNAAREQIAPVVRSQTPRHSSRTVAALQPRASRTATGAALTVGPARGARHGAVTVAQVVRWVQRGTGVHGYSRKPIRAKRRRGAMTVFGRAIEQVKGQKPNPFMGRIQALGTLRFARVARAGATDAARAIERVIS